MVEISIQKHICTIGFITLLLFFSLNSKAQNLSQFEENYLEEFDPQGYAYYQYSEGIAEQGKMITQGLTNQLSNYNNLIQTTDPEALLTDFQTKMQNIESLEQNALDQSFNFGQQRGSELGAQINSGDYMGAFTNAINTIGAISEMEKAEKELAAQKEALRQQRVQKMSDIFWKAIEANDKMMKNYLKRAAFSEELKDEAYNLSFVKNLQCYANSMDRNWSSTSTAWLNNNCPKPQTPTEASIQNMFVDEDVQKINIAKRKLKLYEEPLKGVFLSGSFSAQAVFLDGAISFAAAAANANPTAKNFYFLGELYRRKSMMLAYATMLSAKDINASYFSEERSKMLLKVKKGATEEIALAVQENDTEYLKAFLAAKLDRTIKINNRSLLSEAIRLDKPDAVQLILNEYVKDLNSQQRNKKVQRAIMLCAVQNSPNTIERFAKLGVGVDFEINGNSPIEIAAKANATDAYTTLLNHSTNKSAYKESTNSTVEILLQAETNPNSIAQKLDNDLDDNTVATLTTKMVNELEDKPFYINVLSNSKKAIAYVNANNNLQTILKQNFAEEILKPSPESSAYKYISSGLLIFDRIPSLYELIQTQNKSDFNDPKLVKEFLIDFRLDLHKRIMSIMDNQSFKSGSKKALADLWTPYYTNRFKVLNELKYSTKSLIKSQERIITSNIYVEYDNLPSYDSKGNYDDLFKQYIMNEYQIVNDIPLSDKLDFISKNIQQTSENPHEERFYNMFTKEKGYTEKFGLDGSKERAFTMIYAYYALLKGKPLDSQSMKVIFEDNLTVNRYREKEDSDKNIAFLAFDSDNQQLFEALDEKFNLAGVTDKNGVKLSNYIFDGNNKSDVELLFTGKRKPIATAKVFYSDDFQISKSKELFYTQLSKVYSLTDLYLEKDQIKNKILELLTTFNFNGVNDKISRTKGTFLHWLVDYSLIKAKEDWGIGHRNMIHQFNIDKNIEDDNGETALQYLKSKKREFKSLKKGGESGKPMYDELEIFLSN